MSLVPLFSPGNPNYLTGWFPIFDTLHGIRGEIKIIVKVYSKSSFKLTVRELAAEKFEVVALAHLFFFSLRYFLYHHEKTRDSILF